MSTHPGRFALAALLVVVAGTAASSNPGPPERKNSADAARTDRQGDALPASAIARLGTVRLRNGAGIFPIAFAPDGKTVVTAGGSPWVQQGVQSADSTIRLWDVATGKERRQLTGHPGAVTSLAFSPNGKTLAACTPQEGSVRLWDLGADGEPRQIQLGADARAQITFAFAPDGMTLALAGGAEPVIQLREAATGKELRDFGKQQTPIESLAFSPDGKTLAAKSGGLVRLWDAASGQLVRKFRPRTYYAKQKRLGIEAGGFGSMNAPIAAAPVLFTPDGKTIVAEGGDNTVHLWEAATGQELRQLMHRGPVVSAALSPDGRRLGTGCVDNTIRVWDLATGKEVLHLEGHFGGYMGVAFSPDGKLLASAGGDHTVHLWDAATGKELHGTDGHQGEVVGGAFLAGGKVMITAGRDNTVRCWDVASGKELRRFSNTRDLIDHVAFAPDGKTLVTGSEEDEMVHVWDAATGKHLRELPARPFGLAITPDGKHLASVGADGSVQLAPAGGGDVRPIDGIPRPVTAVAFAPAGKAVALALPDNTLRLWDPSAGKELRQFEAQAENDGTLALLFAPDGKLLASLHGNNVIRFWDVASGRLRHQLQHGGDMAFANMSGSAAFAPDGRSFATSGSGDRVVRLWEVATGKERRHFEGHRGPVSFATFSPDGRLLASGGWDTTTLIWDVTASADDRGPVADLASKDLEDLWIDLADPDAAKAFRAIGRLARAPEPALPFLQKHLQPVAPVDEQRIARLIADLDSDQFGVRQKSSEELEKLGPLSEPELRKALALQVSLEARRRLEQLLEKMQSATPSADRLRTGRALEVLERIGTPEAKRLLETLAQGAPQAVLSQDAKAALDRLAQRLP